MATLTRAALEAECCRLFGRLMDLVGLYGGVSDGTNPTLNSAIRDGLQRMGYSIADPAGLTVADGDLAVLDPKALRRLLEWTELHVLEWVQRDWYRAESPRAPGLDITTVGGIVRDPLSTIRDRLTSRIGQLRQIVCTPYQSMNVPLDIQTITRGSACDPTTPPALERVFPPWTLTASIPWGWYGNWYGAPPDIYWGYPW